MLFQLIIIQVITFLAIVLVLRKLLYAETAREAKRLRELKEENARRENELQKKIEEADRAYQEKIVRAKEDTRRMRQEADKELDGLRKDTLDKAKEEADRVVSAAINAKDKMRDEVANEMRKKVPALAAQIFRELVSPKAKEITHRELVRAVVNEVKKADKARFDMKVKKGELVSAYPLARGEKSELLSSLAKQMKQKVTFDEKEDKNLVAGVVIKLGALVIDGSLENRLRQVEQK